MPLEVVGGTGGDLGGLTLLSARVDRSVGLSPDVSVFRVLMPDTGFPEISAPAPGQEWALLSPSRTKVTDLQTLGSPDDKTRPTTGGSIAQKLVPAAGVAMNEALRNETWSVEIPTLLVDQVVLEDPGNADPEVGGYQSNLDGAKVLTVTCRDERALYPTHSRFMEQNQWNVRDAAGEVRPSSKLLVDGELVEPTIEQLVKHIATHLPSRKDTGPEVIRTPARWRQIRPTFEDWPIGISGYEALGRVLDRYPARVALTTQGALSFWEQGEGNGAGFYSTGRGKGDNDQPIPPTELHSDTIERGLGWGSGYQVAIGPHKIASVRLPLEPVVFPGKPLTDRELYPDQNLPAVGPDFDAGLGGDPVNFFDFLRAAKTRARVANLEEAIRVLETVSGGDVTQVGALRRELEQIQNTQEPLTLREIQFALRLVMRGDFPSVPGPLGTFTLEDKRIIQRDGFRFFALEGTVGPDKRLASVLPIEDRAETDSSGRRRSPKAQTYRTRIQSSSVGRDRTTSEPGRLTTLGAIESRPARLAMDAAHDVAKLTEVIGLAMSSKTIGATRIAQLRLDLSITGRLDLSVLDGIGGTDRQKVREQTKETESRLMSAKRGLIRAVLQDQATRRAIRAIGYSPGQLIGRLSGEGLTALMPELKAKAANYPALASAYRERLTVLLENQAATATQVFTQDIGVQLAELLIQLGDVIKNNSSLRKSVEKHPLMDRARKLVGDAAERIREYNRRVAAGEQVTDANRRPESEVFDRIQWVVNDPILDDAGLVLRDPARGIWESTRGPVGHIDAVGSRTRGGRALIPRVQYGVFGVRMKPPLNPRSSGNTSRPVTQPSLTREQPEGWDEWLELVLEQKHLPDATSPRGKNRPLWRPLDEVQPIIPEPLKKLQDGEDLGFFVQPFQRPPRPKPGEKAESPAPVDVAALPKNQGPPLYDPSLQELITLDGGSNRGDLLIRAQELAAAKFAEQVPEIEGRQQVYLRPWRVECNGRVSGVRWEMQDEAVGWVITIVSGLEAEPFRHSNKSYVRRRKNQDTPASPRPTVDASR